MTQQMPEDLEIYPCPAPERGYRIVVDTRDLEIKDPVRVWMRGEWEDGTVTGRDVNRVAIRRSNDLPAVVERFRVAMPIPERESSALPRNRHVWHSSDRRQIIEVLRRADSAQADVARAMEILVRTQKSLDAIQGDLGALAPEVPPGYAHAPDCVRHLPSGWHTCILVREPGDLAGHK